MIYKPSYSCVFNYVSFVISEEFEDTKGVIRIPKSKDRQHNDQMKKIDEKATIQQLCVINLNDLKLDEISIIVYLWF